MRSRKMVLRAGALLAVLVLSAIVIARQYAGTGPDTPSDMPYVALGDSYTSGPRIPDQTGRPPGCARSTRNYPALVARELGIPAADVRDMSCSGATIASLSATQDTGDGVNAAQITALNRRTRLVTLGIGGNDVGFSEVFERCVAQGLVYRLTGGAQLFGRDAPCRRRYLRADADRLQKRIDAAGARLARTLVTIAGRAPRAAVFVVGYPALLPARKTSCAGMVLAPGDVDFLRRTELSLNRMLRQRAEETGAIYVDTYAPSTDHDACAPAGRRYVEPLHPASAAAPLHPNARGESVMAHAVLGTMRKEGVPAVS
ncbi:SGNH/GDSL hydrolase family protein [Streptomyces sp. NPDC047000]|uniref:SGNH/GDSL hydrolase family protein n=1 Tax=Streptomyces sp. NPDC047000 TaxID=3155474 RepID=UPI0034107ED1